MGVPWRLVGAALMGWALLAAVLPHRLTLRASSFLAAPPPVDLALPEECIAIEVDGPHHFTTNTFRPLGEMYCRWVAPGLAIGQAGLCQGIRRRNANLMQLCTRRNVPV